MKPGRILAIRLARMGDIILLSPTLAAIKAAHPDCSITLLTERRYAPLTALFPAVNETLTIDRFALRDGPRWAGARSIVRALKEMRRRNFDLAIDFHSFRETNILTRLSGAVSRVALRRRDGAYLEWCFNVPPVEEDKSLHVSDMFRRIAERGPGIGHLPPVPETTIAPGRRREDAVVFYVGAGAPDRCWPGEKFAELADRILERRTCAVTVVEGERETVCNQIHSRAASRDRMKFLPNANLESIVESIRSARLLVSNDTGPMHLGPAAGVPTIGLFSVGYPEHYQPLGRKSRYLVGKPIGEIGVREVLAFVDELWPLTESRDLPG